MSQNNTVTINDILASIKKYGKENILTWNPADYRDNKQRNKTAKFDCTWVPLKFKMENGKEVDLKKLKYMKVLTASAAKLPSASGEDAVKNMLIAFRKFTIEEIMVGDYAPKQKENEEEQLLENERATKEAHILKKNTDDFNDAMEAIDLSYQRVAEELKSCKQLGFTLNKDAVKAKQVRDVAKRAKKRADEIEKDINDSVTVYKIRQTSYEDPDSKEEIELKFPLTRIKLMISTKDGRVGTESYNKDQGKYIFEPNVYDARKKNANGLPVLAKVKVNGKSQPLDASTAGSFITYKSIIGGIIEINDIVISKFGISLSNRFKEMYVKRHKKSLTEPTFTAEEFKELQGSDDESDEEVEINKEDVEPGSDLEDVYDETNDDPVPEDTDIVISDSD